MKETNLKRRISQETKVKIKNQITNQLYLNQISIRKCLELLIQVHNKLNR